MTSVLNSSSVRSFSSLLSQNQITYLIPRYGIILSDHAIEGNPINISHMNNIFFNFEYIHSNFASR